MWFHRVLQIACLTMLVLDSRPCEAQRLSAAVGLDVLTYHGALNQRDGSRAAHLAAQYAIHPRGLLGLGVSLGSFEAPDGESSSTSYSIFLEPAFIFGSGRYRGYVGPRAGWEQERLGSSLTHVGGSFGAALGGLFSLDQDWAVGLRTQWDHLRLGASGGSDASSLRGERWQIGAELRWTQSPRARGKVRAGP